MKKSYNQFRKELLNWWRENHANSSLPREHVIDMLYEDYLKEYELYQTTKTQ